MAAADDAATVLEQWIMDTSNLSPELNHLLEEIEAKDRIADECRKIIASRDLSLQKHVKSNGATAPNPKEEQYVKTVMANFDKAQAIQVEKCALSEKAAVLLDRHIKRLDQQIRGLENNGVIPPDPLLPSLLNNTSASRIPGLSSGTSTPLNPINGNAAAGTAAPSTTIANSALARLVTSNIGVPSSTRGGSPAGTPTSATSQARGARESSTDAKRRRLNLPAASSNLRQSSAGPGTPKAGTPQPTGRAGSVPRGTTKKDAKTSVKHLAPPKGGQVNPASKRKKKSGARKKGGVSDADDSAMSAAGDESGSERLSAAGDKGKDGTIDRDVEMGGVEDDDDEGGDTNLYCTCRSVSYGNMVACDNDACPYEWFHWGCVGLTKEPAGSWHCEECSIKLGLKK